MTDEILLAEYSSLHSEIEKRAEFMHQRENIVITIWGVALTIGFSADVMGSGIEPLLIYPWVAFFLSAGWFYDFHRIGQIGRYLKEKEIHNISGQENCRWEQWLQKDLDTTKVVNRRRFRIFEFIGSGGVFIGTQFATLVIVVIARPELVYSKSEMCLFVLAAFITLMTFIKFKQNIFPSNS